MSNNIVFTFNKFFYDLIKDLKADSSALKSLIKKNYSVRNKETHEHFDLFSKNITEDVIKVLVSSPPDVVFTFPALGSVHVLIDADISDLLLQIKPEFKDKLLGYIYVLTLLVIVDKREDLFLAVMHAVNAIQKNESYTTLIEDIIDDDVRGLLDRIAANSTFAGSAAPPTIEDTISNSQIGSIAKEIAESLDLKGLNLEKPEDILSGGNGALIGDLVSKVGSKLQQKFESGAIKQDDLIKEAVSMMGMFGSGGGAGGGGGMDLFANLMKSMAGNMAPPSSTKDRLRKKLESRKSLT